MSVKKAKWMLSILQAAMLGLLFLPVARFSDSGAQGSTLDLLRSYEKLGYRFGSFLYLLAAVCGPVMSAVCIWRLAVRKNFGAASWFSALIGLVHACFYSAAGTALAGLLELTWVHYFVVLFSLVCMFTAIYSYLMAPPTPTKDTKH
jgi:hypothetical protein